MDQPVIYSTASSVTGTVLGHRVGFLTLGLVNTDYQLELVVDEQLAFSVGSRVTGQITGKAKRVDVLNAGGKYIDPVYGRPRRLQGKIVAVSKEDNTITVYGGCPFVCALMAPQQAKDYKVGQIVGFALERGAKFELQQ